MSRDRRVPGGSAVRKAALRWCRIFMARGQLEGRNGAELGCAGRPLQSVERERLRRSVWYQTLMLTRFFAPPFLPILLILHSFSPTSFFFFCLPKFPPPGLATSAIHRGDWLSLIGPGPPLSRPGG